jgi:O-antigen/teichoic acid export membrane protein
VRTHVGHLSKGVAIYGTGDALIQLVNLLLVAVYVKGGYLGPVDYGALAVIISIETFTRVVSRLGLDGAYMRAYHDRAEDGTLPRLTSTLLYAVLGFNAALAAIAIAGSAWLAGWLLEGTQYVRALQLMFLNTALISATFIPFHLMRLRNQAVAFSAFTFSRSIGTVILRIVFVIGMGWGVTGMYAADLVVTGVLVPLLWRGFTSLVRRDFSGADLREALRFGLPRVPHGLAQQALDAGNKLLLNAYLPLRQVGVYQNGVTLGTAIRFFTSAFETAWAPFYYATFRRDDAKTVFSKMTTYGVAVLVLLAALTIAVAEDAVLLLLEPEWLEAARVMPFIAVGLACQGVYLLTSIGLNLMNRTSYYPVATFVALGVGLGSGAWLMPAYGLIGAAIAFMLSFVAQAAVAFLLSRSVYPIEYEGHRLARLVVAGTIATLAGRWAAPDFPPLAGVVVRALAVLGTYGLLLWVTGFLRASERRFLVEALTTKAAKTSKD